MTHTTHFRDFGHPARLVCACQGPVRGSGLDSSGQDPSVRFQDDLFRAANGRWLSRTDIPPDKASYGAFAQLGALSEERLHAIVEGLAAETHPRGSLKQRVSAFYTAYMNTDAIDAAGLAPVTPLLAEIDAIASVHELSRWQGRMQGHLDTPVSWWVAPDFTEPGIQRALTWQGGLGLPDRDYFLRHDDTRLAQAHAAYAVYLTTLATLAGEPHPDQAARRVLAIEQHIAACHWDKEHTRDPQKIHHPMAPEALAQQAPGLDWPAFLEGAGLGGVDRLSVSQPSAVIGIAGLFARLPLADWKLYFRLHLLDASAATLPKPFRVARFAFRGTALTGATEEPARWRDAMAALNRALGEDLGQLYVARHFTPEQKTRAQALVEELLAACRESIDALVWMTPATKLQAQTKLSRYVTKIGYPQAWRDYGGLVIDEGDAQGNALRSARFEWARLAQKAGRPVDRHEWAMTPQTVNACYDPSRNEIVFPAAILQPPFFDMGADDAMNYGAIGAVIGHEISHGFDDQGSKFDGDGVLRNWWTDADRNAFDAIGAGLVAQYEAYEPLPGRRLNGRLTLGENIADLAGLQIAFKAYQRSLRGRLAPVIDGVEGAQRFFIGWAQAWRDKVREPRALQLLSTDPHSPAEFRANGAALNHDGFHSAFGTQPGDGMFKALRERIRIW